MTDPLDPARVALLRAMLPHVAFEGWQDSAFSAAAADCDMTTEAARAQCPRGGLDLAVDFHRAGDAAMLDAIRAADLSGMRFRDKIAFAVRARLNAVTDKEAVRRGTALFALPQHAAEGAGLIWGTADAIWTSLGDTSRDVNWYTKRATLSAVYGATVLYWLGDHSAETQATDAFIDRRIGDVMAFETFKAKVNENALLRPFLAPLNGLLAKIQAPASAPRDDLPGHWSPES